MITSVNVINNPQVAPPVSPAAKEAEHIEAADGAPTDAREKEEEGEVTADDALPTKTDESASLLFRSRSHVEMAHLSPHDMLYR